MDASYSATRKLEIAGREWTIVMRSIRTTSRRIRNRALMPLVVAGGLLTTFLLFGASWAQTSATADGGEGARATARAEFRPRAPRRGTHRAAGKRQSRLEIFNRNLESIVAVRTADLQAANEEIQRFAYIVSHDLRAPLVNVMGFTSELAVAGETSRNSTSDTAAKIPDLANTDARRDRGGSAGGDRLHPLVHRQDGPADQRHPAPVARRAAGADA